jgi:hypothetical protein
MSIRHPVRRFVPGNKKTGPGNQSLRRTEGMRVGVDRDKRLLFAKLQSEWYAKLRKTGFVDIECGKDLNKSNAQTLRGAGPNSHVLWDFSQSDADGDGFGPGGDKYGYDESRGVQDLAKFEYFDRIGSYGQSMPEMTSRQRRRKLVVIMMGNGAAKRSIARELKMNLDYVGSIWDATLAGLRLPSGRSQANASEPPPEPKPLRILSKADIAKLGYKSPKQIKDK